MLLKRTEEVIGLTIFLFFLSLILGSKSISSAQAPSLSQIERSQEILDKEKILREKFEKGEKVFIKKIIVQGVTLLTGDEIKETILRFEKRWLTEEDIQQILGLIQQAYGQKGYKNQLTKISYQIKKKCLIIRVEELAL